MNRTSPLGRCSVSNAGSWARWWCQGQSSTPSSRSVLRRDTTPLVVGLAPGGRDVTPAGAAVPVADPHGEALVLAEQPACPSEVQRLRLAAEDDGDEVRVAGQPHRLRGRDDVSGAQLGGAHRSLEPVEVDGDHHRGGAAPVRGQQPARAAPPAGRTKARPRRTSCGRRLPVSGSIGSMPCSRWPRRGRGVGLEVGPQPSGDRVREPALQVGGAVAAPAQAQPGGLRGPAFLLLEAAAFVVLGDLGGHDLEDLATEDPQPGGVEVGGLGDQVGLGLDQDRLRRGRREARPARWRSRAPARC